MVSTEHQKLLGELHRQFPRIPPAELEDSLSHAYVGALRHCRAADPPAVYVFLRRSAKNYLLNYLDRQAQRSRSDDADFDFDACESPDPTPERGLLSGEQRRLAARVMAELPPRTQAVVYMRVCEDLQRSVIAERVGLSPKAVKKELERGMRILRDHLCQLAGAPCDAD